MQTIKSELDFFFALARTQTVMARRFDSRLGGGLGFTDLVILDHLSRAEDGKMRRIDLAEKVGLTASGITRLLAPMEKIGLVSREKDAADARVSFVTLAPGGRQLLSERREKAEMIAQEALPEIDSERLTEFTRLLRRIGGA